MDLTSLRMLRTPRAAAPPDAVVTDVRQPEPVPPADPGENPPEQPVDPPDPVALARPEGQPDTPVQKLLAGLGDLDRWLVARGDLPEAAAFRQQRDTLRDGKDEPPFDEVRRLIGAAMVAEVKKENPDLVRLARLTRLLLVLDTADPPAFPDADVTGPDAVYDRLNRRFPKLPAGVLVEVAGDRAPIRDVTVSDLYVVRNEWSCYRAGEIAAITNVLAGETFKQKNRQTREETVTERTESERIESTERTEQDTTATELSREVDRAAALEVSAQGNVDVSGQYGLTKYGVSAGVSASASLSENTRQASKLSRELVSKAVAKVESRVREERVRTITTRTEDLVSHIIENDSGEHRNGVYRWVDRIDRYQVFRYPDRLQLEFEIPEPGQYLRHRLLQPQPVPGGIEPPPAFDTTAAQITEANYAALALRYHASTLPPPPDATVSVTSAVVLDAPGDPVKNRDVVWVYPRMQKNADIVVPTGYAAESLTFAGSALPINANWRVEAAGANPTDDKTDVEGFHQITMTVAAGGKRVLATKGGERFSDFSVQITTTLKDDRSRQRFGAAILATPTGNTTNRITFDNPVVEKVSLGVTVAGSNSATVSVEVRCGRRAEALHEWRNSVYDALFDAWRAWDEDFRRQSIVAPGPRLSAVDSGSPALNAELVREELKRLVVTWMTGDAAFNGRDGMQAAAGAGGWVRFDIDKARTVAPEIQFMEQALEWANITYVPYPYFWARGAEWDELTALRGADPEFVRFLRAGSVRVVVPARRAFERAVFHYLVYGEPFLGDPLPIPGDDLYISIATEIHDLTQPPGDGEPGASWEARLPTTLMWLDPDAELPHNEVRRLGLPPHEPTDPLCAAPAPGGNNPQVAAVGVEV
jgi:hypothetical protein